MFCVKSHRKTLLRSFLFFIFTACLNCSAAFVSNNTRTVNILTWWGYLDSPEMVSSIEKQCHAKLSFDEYYSSEEFLRRLKAQKQYYDIVIFEDIIYHLIKEQLPKVESDLYKNAKYYNPVIRDRFYSEHYPKNVAYFFQSITGFVWNPLNVSLSEKDSLKNIFNKANGKIITLPDDPIIVNKLLQEYNSTTDGLNTLLFSRFAKCFHLYTTNNYGNLYDQKNFALAYTWSGDGIVNLKQAKAKLSFIVNPEYSFISSDLLAQLNNKEQSRCVANMMAKQSFLSKLQNLTYYFSPYSGSNSDVVDPVFQHINAQYLKNLKRFKWVNSLKDEKEFEDISRKWQFDKLNINQ